MKKFFSEFKAFIKRGNVIDLAVGVIIGGAFSSITSSLVNDLIMPLISAVLAWIGLSSGSQNLCLVLNGVDKYVIDASTGAEVINPEAILWNYGNFIQVVLNFLLIAIVLFLLIKAINFANAELDEVNAKSKVFTIKEVKAMRKQGLSYAQIDKLREQKLQEAADAKRLAEEEAKRNAPKTQEQLLQEIIELLNDQRSDNQ